ncbi:hypothetical protein Arnit_0558 [Arcobacter nitrofigilis DSM 7299]|uniref:FeoB-associated Cys-rich membrane protein n=1 Tax=Arcobacter nitrofigilis (strain ATCC 33309 / DSM 7299 / CCUG 15893 / LMG 7604 / NCTC 12251 / CI) TaxID=572480 RepID=D5UZI6_ARCNC|nr:FeoB-associated Cys-rich membrane protein [Arcobacter nitrofigilis]ADG92223.1 hypothetical protein Arnit_0558 [Arcobacter nitrofigilis DSM 7299]
MNLYELLFTIIIFAFALFYIYKSLFKKKTCGGSCGCGSQNKPKEKKKYLSN